jgi:hypothetical protein
VPYLVKKGRGVNNCEGLKAGFMAGASNARYARLFSHHIHPMIDSGDH